MAASQMVLFFLRFSGNRAQISTVLAQQEVLTNTRGCATCLHRSMRGFISSSTFSDTPSRTNVFAPSLGIFTALTLAPAR